MSCDRKGPICAHYGFCAAKQLRLPPSERSTKVPDQTLTIIAAGCSGQKQPDHDAIHNKKSAK